ncbi:MAG: DUF881 domain-containing protein [Clostridia bacterium]|nr:DUF881 domain-containing protein [Clostridia bacterium]
MRHWYIYLTIIAVLCGTLFAWVFLAQAKYRAQAAEARKRNLVQVIRTLEAETQNLENEIAALRRRLDTVEQRQGERENELSGLARDLQQAKLQAGLAEVEGPGVVITLDDNREGALRAQASKPGQYQPEDFIVHDKNLLYLVNELRLAGAEAIAINNQRLIASSDIRCVGTAILVNATRLVPPYEIRAIGNAETLAAAVSSGQEYPFLKGKGFPVSLQKQERITVPAFRGTLVTAHLWSAGELPTEEASGFLQREAEASEE